jgi:hypothetical protein
MRFKPANQQVVQHGAKQAPPEGGGEWARTGTVSRHTGGAHWAPPERVRRDIKLLARFMEIYCDNNHADRLKYPLKPRGPIRSYMQGMSPELCLECSKLLLHAAAKTAMCPYDPKPKCKKCPTHCYDKRYREEIRKVMRFSGMYLMKHGRLHLAMQYFF